MQPQKHCARLLIAAEQATSPALTRVILDEAVTLADALGDESLGYAARLTLISAAADTCDTTTRLSAFDWCVSRHLSNPTVYPASIATIDLLNESVLIPEVVARNASCSLASITNELARLQSLVDANGQAPTAGLYARLKVARVTRQPGELESITALLHNAAPDRYTPCPTCNHLRVALDFAAAERFAESAAAFDVYFDATSQCAACLPEAYARSLSVYLATRQPLKASSSHQRGYELVRSNPRQLALLAAHLEYCGMIGDVPRALTLIERHLLWLDADPLDSYAQFEALRALAGVCRALVGTGHGDRAILVTADSALPGYLRLDSTPGSTLTVHSLGERCTRAARILARCFDERHANEYFTARLVAMLDLANVADVAGRDRPSVRARQALALPFDEVSPAQLSALGRTAPASELWLQLARERASVEDTATAESALQHAHEALEHEVRAAGGGGGGGGGDDSGGTGAGYRGSRGHSESDGGSESDSTSVDRLHVRCQIYGLQISLAVARGDDGRALNFLGLRADTLIAARHLDLAEAELNLGLVMFGADRADGADRGGRADGADGEQALRAALRQAREERAEPEVELSILNALAERLLRTQQPQEASVLALEAVKLCGHDPENPHIQRSLMTLAHAQSLSGQLEAGRATTTRLVRHDLDRATKARALLLRAACTLDPSALNDAVSDADRALALYSELGYGKGIIDACAQLALLLEEVGVQVGVVEAWRQALQECERLNQAGTSLIRFRLARAHLAAGDGDAAAVNVESVLDEAYLGRAPTPEIVELLYWLGHSYRATENDELAYSCWSVALSLAVPSGAMREAVRLGLALGRLLFDCNDSDAVDVLLETVNRARQLPEPWELVDSLHLLGQAQCEFGQAEGLETLDEAIRVADEHKFDLDALVASVTESRAHGLDALGRDDEALETARRSAWLFERVGERSSAGLAHLFAARMLECAHRTDEAQSEYERSLELVAGDSAVAQLVAGELHALTSG
ncbi:hypothetical protein [Subtercola lobariae]|uniref:Tetratricopeptide repeat protein n=1 Tax=Subtercola lobariae TaxID=1588641 RepID=A0A917BEA6_9MICO|nr:hypothetical protein [Subtercola lobariae]GGF36493.1 hypothetical protein GCM10011399_31740 [Subtercola lobariae]